MGVSKQRTVPLLGAVFGCALVVLSGPSAIAQEPTGSMPAPDPYAASGAIPGSGAELTLGYIPPADDEGSGALISQGVAGEAAVAGAVLARCGEGALSSDPVACARQLAEMDVDGVIDARSDALLSGAICAASDGAPTVAIGLAEPACRAVLIRPDDREAGRMAGAAVATALLDERSCGFDRVILLAPPAADGPSWEQRLAGLVAGFESACGEVPAAGIMTLELDASEDPARSPLAPVIGGIPAQGVAVILAADDPTGLHALRVAEAIGRGGDIRIGALGGDPSAWSRIACHPAWVADTGYFPERIGRTAVPALIDLIMGREVPSSIAPPLAILDRHTIQSFYPDVPAC